MTGKPLREPDEWNFPRNEHGWIAVENLIELHLGEGGGGGGGGGDEEESMIVVVVVVEVVVVVVVVDAFFSSSHSWCLLLWTEVHELHGGRVSQLLLQTGWFQSSLRFPHKLPWDDLWGHQGFPRLVLEDMDMALEGSGARKRDRSECALWSCQIGPST